MSRKKRPPTRTGKRLRCNRCGCYAPKDLTSKAAENWSGKHEGGKIVLILCPLCQTPLEHAAAEANDAELAVARADGGQFLPDPVLCITGTLENPGTVLYGRGHLQRISVGGQAENLGLVQLPPDTRCEPVVGGVVVYMPGQRLPRP
ncbi:hypothetical protein [Streptomyces sp. SID14515]|uniref:hypothetical protein n=1 Tax=Streptomyces sp. SID14515 TaxID=2706074 RepID=UPI0013CB95F6|nr:hypothetical protein [Streptomyces sp. SID14515]NEB42229.1 hypothetical protein [Streptomyces sp. SID14515]